MLFALVRAAEFIRPALAASFFVILRAVLEEAIMCMRCLFFIYFLHHKNLTHIFNGNFVEVRIFLGAMIYGSKLFNANTGDSKASSEVII
jgi:hypothetical protein